MGRVDVCLSRSYVILTSLIAVTSALLLAMTLFSHGYFHDDDEIEKIIAVLHAMYIVSIITLLLAIIGLYGACKKKQWALILFVVGMILSSMFMMAGSIQGLTVRPQIAKELKMQYLLMLPLSNASEALIDSLNEVQAELQCCGLEKGYLDWGYNISESCLCVEESTKPCVAAPRNSSLFEHVDDDEPIMIYKEPCIAPLILHEIIIVNSVLGVVMGITLLWLLSVTLSIIILCRMNKKQETPAVVYSSEAKAGNYTTLTEAADYT